MMESNYWARFLAVSVSMALHATVFWQFGGSVAPHFVTHPVREISLTRLNLVAPQSQKSNSEPVIEKTESKTEKELEKPIQKKHVKPKRVRSKHVSKPEIKKRQHHQLEKTLEKPVEESSHQQQVVQQQPVQTTTATAPIIDEGVIERERQRYLAELMKYIEKHKFYPKTARRRGIQGDIHISFMLFADGTTKQIMTQGASDILQKSAKKSVIKAIPMPKPPSVIHCPMHCEFTMRYALD